MQSTYNINAIIPKRIIQICGTTKGKSVKEIADEVGSSTTYINFLVKRMLEDKILRVVAYTIPKKGGHHQKIYSSTKGENAQLKLIGKTESNIITKKRRRAERIEKYGKRIAWKIESARSQGGADRIVIDGKTIYERGKGMLV